MILSADPSLLGLGFGVTGTVDAPTSTVLFLALRSQGSGFPCCHVRSPGRCILGWARCELPEPDEP
jgi:hypothetical protein